MADDDNWGIPLDMFTLPNDYDLEKQENTSLEHEQLPEPEIPLHPAPDTAVITDDYADIWEEIIAVPEPVLAIPEPVTTTKRRKGNGNVKRGKNRILKEGKARRNDCEHHGSKYACRICSSLRFCRHDRIYSSCDACRGIRCPEHGQWLYNCRVCLLNGTLAERDWDPNDYSHLKSQEESHELERKRRCSLERKERRQRALLKKRNA